MATKERLAELLTQVFADAHKATSPGECSLLVAELAGAINEIHERLIAVESKLEN
ncbi:MAG: hypothetical protein JSS27_20470 [Planctomycetes bacterium]|nr:hypothetical protein [Planctomycetota bacterium]